MSRSDFAVSLDETLGPQIYGWLRRAIVRMELKPGESLSEKEVAQRLGVSRQPVREAFIKLQDAGLVRVLPQRGTFVVPISIEAVETARFVRLALESALVSEAAVRRSGEDVARLEAAIGRQAEAIAARDYERFYGEDEIFHRTLAQIAGREAVWRLIEESKAQMDRVRYLSVPHATPVETLITQHEAIAAGIKAGDAEKAVEATRAHLAEILAAFPAIAARFPDAFAGGIGPRGRRASAQATRVPAADRIERRPAAGGVTR